MKLIYRIGGSIATASLIAGSFAGAVFAESAVTISGNGNGSDNTVKITQICNTSVVQKNKTTVETAADAISSTGGNQANNNTGGDVTVDTGNATSSINVLVGGSTNDLAQPPDCCDCLGENPDVAITGNGTNSTNTVRVRKLVDKQVKQRNRTRVGTLALTVAKTGKNKANGNTGGTVDVTTGNSNSAVDVTIDPSSNNL